MKFPQRRSGDRRHPAALSQEVNPDLFFSDALHVKPDHHTRALCKLVRRTLSTVLAGECADPLLQDLLVLAVLPAPNAGHLLVVVAPRTVDTTLAEALERLAKVTPLLRARIAQDTTRKRTPELSFDVLGKGVASLEPPVEDEDSAHEDFEREGRP
jgi:ribosome-binding factor A